MYIVPMQRACVTHCVPTHILFDHDKTICHLWFVPTLHWRPHPGSCLTMPGITTTDETLAAAVMGLPVGFWRKPERACMVAGRTTIFFHQGLYYSRALVGGGCMWHTVAGSTMCKAVPTCQCLNYVLTFVGMQLQQEQAIQMLQDNARFICDYYQPTLLEMGADATHGDCLYAVALVSTSCSQQAAC